MGFMSLDLPEDHPAHGCEMPALTQIVPPQVENAAFANRFFGAGITVPPYHVLALKIVALAQVAVAEYEAARRLLMVAQSPTGRTPHWARGHFEGVAHLEMCVIVLDRLFVTAEQLEACGVMPEHARTCLPSRTRRTMISKFRNGIEHADKKIGQPLAEGDPIVLHAARREVELREHRMRYEQLVRCLEQGIDLASALSGFPPG
jgi:hypothetical protein